MRDEFDYFECGHCCCLSLQNAPEDMSRFYPAEKYYSFSENSHAGVPRNLIRRMFKRVRDQAVCFGSGPFSRWLTGRYPNQDASDVRKWLRHTSLRSFGARILDVGSGDGWHLSRLGSLGFTDLTGVDPYLPEDVVSGSIRIYARPLSTLADTTYDFIMMHHSLEHMPSADDVLRQVRQLLAPEGVCLIRVPIVSRGPWRTYGVNWAEIDAPRHFVLHSEMSLKLAADSAGLEIKAIEYESELFTYTASEMYQRDISLFDSDAGCNRDPTMVFNNDELQAMESMSRTHHVPGWAGRAAFYLTSADSSPNAAVFVSP